MQIGDWFIVKNKGHFSDKQIHRCSGLPKIVVRGEPDLDLGKLVQFTILDYYGKPMRHVVPIEWCIPCDRPNLKKRVIGVAKSDVGSIRSSNRT